MSEERDTSDLLERAAERAKVPTAVLERLLALEPSFPDFTVYGSKTDFQRRVWRILEDAAAAEEGGA